MHPLIYFPDTHKPVAMAQNLLRSSFALGLRPCLRIVSALRTVVRGGGVRVPGGVQMPRFIPCGWRPLRTRPRIPKTIRHNPAVIMLERFSDIIKNQHAHQAAKWKVSHLGGQQPACWLAG